MFRTVVCLISCYCSRHFSPAWLILVRQTCKKHVVTIVMIVNYFLLFSSHTSSNYCIIWFWEILLVSFTWKQGFISGARNNLPAEEELHYCEIQFIWNIMLVISLVMSVFISKFQWRKVNRAVEIFPLLWISVWYTTVYFVPSHSFECDIICKNINDWLTQKSKQQDVSYRRHFECCGLNCPNFQSHLICDLLLQS